MSLSSPTLASLLEHSAIDAIALTLRLATVTTIALLIIAIPLAWWLSQTRSRWRAPVSALVTLPLVFTAHCAGLLFIGLDGTERLHWSINRCAGAGDCCRLLSPAW